MSLWGSILVSLVIKSSGTSCHRGFPVRNIHGPFNPIKLPELIFKEIQELPKVEGSSL